MQNFLKRFQLGSSTGYWERRYKKNQNSGAGSYGRLARFKADVINKLVAEKSVKSVIDFGCGDGNQLGLANYPRYLGLDVSPTIIEKTRARFADDATKEFVCLADYAGESAELALSLDVIYHLVEDDVFHAYMKNLFDAATRMVIVYASNDASLNTLDMAAHVRHRVFTDWVSAHRPQWTQTGFVKNQYPSVVSGYVGESFYRVYKFVKNQYQSAVNGELQDDDDDSTSFADFFIFER